MPRDHSSHDKTIVRSTVIKAAVRLRKNRTQGFPKSTVKRR